jgi:xanthine dehydrogenase accessory factor
MQRRETEEILRAIRRTRAEGHKAALATVVRVTGSAYRREGARMLIEDNGAMTCMLSGGCLEPAVVEVARAVIRTGRAERRHYDLDEATVWGLGLGCGGSVDVYIEPLSDDPLVGRWLAILERGAPAVMATVLSGGDGRLLFEPGSPTEGAVRPSFVGSAVQELAAQKLEELAPRAETRRIQAAPGSNVEVFFDVSGPPPELVIFGAGHDAIPLAALARDLGWAVTVVDAREAYVTADRFPGASLIVAHPDALGGSVTLGPRTAAIIMNHHLERDAATLGFALASKAASIGVLGPRSRFERLVASLREQGLPLSSADIARVKNPIGLDIGAETPEEVALAIMGALIAERRGFPAGFLSGVEGAIHDPGSRKSEVGSRK